MFDFSAYIQNEWSWAVLALMAIFVGMSKTGIQGYDMQYRGCMSCMACKLKDRVSNVCKYKDALTPVLEEIAQAVGAVLVGIFVFREPATFWRLFFLTTLIASIVGLKTIS